MYASSTRKPGERTMAPSVQAAASATSSPGNAVRRRAMPSANVYHSRPERPQAIVASQAAHTALGFPGVMLRRRPHLLLDVAALLLAGALLVPLLLLWARRAAHPFDLEWMEGGMLAHAWRIQHGLPLYDAPAAEFVPYLYPPGYAAVLAALSTVAP